MGLSILTALYKNGQEFTAVSISDLKSHDNQIKYKGKLFCPTNGCTAKLVYVNRTLKPGYIKTFPREDHSSDCDYRFDRIIGRTGVNTENVINVELSKERKARALKEAYHLSQLTPEEIQNKKTKRNNSKSKRTNTEKKVNSVAVNMVTNTEESNETESTVRGNNILKRTLETLQESDVSKHRLLVGNIVKVNFDKENATLFVEENKNSLQVKFEEVFFANSPAYLGFFHLVNRLIEENKELVFAGIGQVRKNSSSELELVIYNGEDFTLNGSTLLSIAINKAREDEQ